MKAALFAEMSAGAARRAVMSPSPGKGRSSTRASSTPSPFESSTSRYIPGISPETFCTGISSQEPTAVPKFAANGASDPTFVKFGVPGSPKGSTFSKSAKKRSVPAPSVISLEAEEFPPMVPVSTASNSTMTVSEISGSPSSKGRRLMVTDWFPPGITREVSPKKSSPLIAVPE